MQPYQNYYPMNNNFMSNPYMDRMAQLQQYQQSLQQPMQNIVSNQIPGANQQYTPMGKIIENVDVLKTTEVPMDGNTYYFPKADGTAIFGKRWENNGTTSILTFKPCLDEGVDENTLDEEKLNVEQFNKVVEGILNEIQTINSKIDKISKPSTTTRGKKEVNEDE